MKTHALVSVFFLGFSLFHASAFAEASRAGESDPDNLRVNQRDKLEKPVPSQQITRQIRKELKDDDSLSHSAKTIKIVTNAKSVLLSGPVSSDEEKTKIEEIAQKVAANREIRNELQVK